MWPFHLGCTEDRDFSAQPLPHCSTARPRRPADLPSTQLHLHPRNLLYAFQRRGKKHNSVAKWLFKMTGLEAARVRTPGNVWKCPHAAGAAGRSSPGSPARPPGRPHKQQHAPKCHSLNMQMSQLISCRFPINYYSLSVSILVSDVRFQGYSLARSEQMLREKWRVNIYGLKGETLEFEDLS